MCGIAGYIGVTQGKIDLNIICNALQHRGPDGNGIYSDVQVGLVHTRLAIIDLSDAAKQPFQFKNWVLVFNGEIYNYKEIKEVLIQQGYSFETKSDTEVIIKAYDCWRERAIEKFIGMFAFAIYDTISKSLQLFRDRIGVKPLYYGIENDSLYFASELKVFKHFPITKEVSAAAMSNYFRFGFTPSNQSIYTSIKKLEAGTYLIFQNQNFTIKHYWHVPQVSSIYKSENDIIDELHALLISSCKYRMISDVPVGVFLSGGVDSSLVSAILSRHFGQIKAFNIGFEEVSFNESIYAENVAKQLQLDYYSSILSLNEAKKYFNQFYSIYDEPFADTSGIPTACVSAIAKSHGVKVVLSADGGDELFAGYNHYQHAIKLYRRLHLLPAVIRRKLVKASRLLITKQIRKSFVQQNFEHRLYAIEELLEAADFKSFYKALISNQAQKELEHLLVQFQTQHDIESKSTHPLYEMRKWDLENYMADDLLVKVDRATMFNQIECREPLLDHRLVEFAFTLNPQLHFKQNTSKYLLKKVLREYIPANLFERKKQGFAIPVFQWFSKDLDQLFNTYLAEDEIHKTGLLNNVEVKNELKKYNNNKLKGKDYNIEKMWRMLSFMMWYKKYHHG